MKKSIILLILAVLTQWTFAQREASFHPNVYVKPLPQIISVEDQPSDYKMTTHLVNIKVPGDSTIVWDRDMEARYIRRLFGVIKDVDCLILVYDKFYDANSPNGYTIENGFSFEYNIQNKIENIGAPIWSTSSLLNSEKMLQFITLSADCALGPQVITHEFFHQWNSFLDDAKYWLITPDHHTGIIEDDNSVFYGHYSDLQHVSDSIYSFKQGFCTGFPGKLQGYLAGLWDMPEELKTLKNWYLYQNLPVVINEDQSQTYYIKADSMVTLNKSRLFNLYGGERVPNYINAKNNFDGAIVVFSKDEFLSDDKLKGFHYSSVLNEFEGTSDEYNRYYDEVCIGSTAYDHPVYGRRQTNIYHSSFKKLHFHTRLFNDDGSVAYPVPHRDGIISGAINVCRGASNVVYSIPKIKYATSYLWTLPDGATGTSSTESIHVNFGENAISGEISVKAINSSGIGDPTTLAIHIIEDNSLPAQAGTINGASTFCSGEKSFLYSIPPILNATYYHWTLPDGGTVITASNKLTINYNALSVSGELTVRGVNCYGEGSLSKLAITINSLPFDAGPVEGPISIREGVSYTYSVPPIPNAIKYLWIKDDEEIETTTNTITVKWDSRIKVGFELKVYGISSCGIGGSSSIQIEVTYLPDDAGEITGPNHVCPARGTVGFSVPPILHATSYQWTLPNGSTEITPWPFIGVNYLGSMPEGYLTVKGINENGEGGASRMMITLDPKPSSAENIIGPTSVSKGDTVSYTTEPILNATSYLWNTPLGFIETESNNLTFTIPVDFNYSLLYLNVNGVNSCGYGMLMNESLQISVNEPEINQLPSEAGPIAGITTVKQGQTAVVYTVPLITKANSYIWTLPEGASGQSSTNSITVNYGESAVSGTITVKGHNDFGDGKESTLSITVLHSVTQNISLNTGWNIISLAVEPENKNLKQIIQPLIDGGKLKKVMDETGKAIEDWGVFGGWQNPIGDWGNTEGYSINVNTPDTIIVEGLTHSVPFEIPLNTGWNIIAWPMLTEQNAIEVFQSLISAGKLKKVMDETGKALEDWGTFGGWQNMIGNLKPGEGYKVNVTSACTLVIYDNTIKSEMKIPEFVAGTHFIPVWQGNGTEHMNINLVEIEESGLIEGDEIGIFDGNLCVGSVIISNFISLPGFYNTLSIPVSANDATDIRNGFINGEKISLKLFRSGVESSMQITPLNNSVAEYSKNGSLWAKVALTTNTLTELNENNIRCFPNPFNKLVTIEIHLPQTQNTNVSVYDSKGALIKKLLTNQMLQNITLTWDGKTQAGNLVNPGVYFIRVNDVSLKVIYE